MSATLQLGAPLDNTMGSMLLGVIVSAVLYGISLLQCLFYFTRYERDPLYLKTLVAATVVLDSLHLGFVIHTVYHYLISNYYQNEALQVMVWSVSLEAIPTGVTAALVQSFVSCYSSVLCGDDDFSDFMHIECGGVHFMLSPYVFTFTYSNFPRPVSQKIYLTAIILILVLGTSACGTAWVVLALEAGTYDKLLRISPLTISINALSTGVDVIIAGTLCFMLHRTRPASLETETMVNRLILFTINTGLLTSLCAIASLISLIVSSNTLVYAAFYFCIGRLYSNSLLASLNARTVIRGQINDIDTNFHIKSVSPRTPVSRDVFARPPGIVTANELSIHIDRETELYADVGYTKYDRPLSENPSTIVVNE